jgi:hypothetical protein
MRSFVAATCCLIVGLEVLIGVPVAVCLGFLCLGVGPVQSVYVSEAQFSAPTCPPPIYSAPMYSPGPVPGGPYAQSYPPTVFPTPIAPAVVASLPASDPASDPLPYAPSSMSSPTQPAVAAKPESSSLQFLAHICAHGDCPEAECIDDSCQESTGDRALVLSLLGTAQLLYHQAEQHEEETEYDLADRLRLLARDLRDEAFSIDRRSPNNPPPPPQSAPAASPAPALKPAPLEEPRTVTVGPPPLG